MDKKDYLSGGKAFLPIGVCSGRAFDARVRRIDEKRFSSNLHF